MKLAIVGSRTFNDYPFMKKILQHYPCTKIISGGAKGADTLAKRYSSETGIPIQEFKPNWDAYGKAAGFIRNEMIVKACDELVAFWNEISRGTAHSIKTAEKNNKPVHIYWPESQNLLDGIGI